MTTNQLILQIRERLRDLAAELLVLETLYSNATKTYDISARIKEINTQIEAGKKFIIEMNEIKCLSI